MSKYAGYRTSMGKCICGDSRELLSELDDESIDLVLTSPPFALQREKEYGNKCQEEYVDWLCEFGRLVFQKLKKEGSFVLDLGGAYEKGLPIHSLYQFRTLIKMCDDIGFSLAQPFYWHNSSALPAPIEWVNKRKLRAKSSVNTIWWFCKSPFCKADITEVLVPYSPRMKKLISDPDCFLKEENTIRPSGHVLKKSSWTKNNGGSIPPNLLQIPNCESASQYLNICKRLDLKRHPARFPTGIPEFFIKFLTSEGDLVVDIFSGSNTTGEVSEKLNRNWLSFELSQEYVATSAFRFAKTTEEARMLYDRISKGEFVKIAGNPQSSLVSYISDLDQTA